MRGKHLAEEQTGVLVKVICNARHHRLEHGIECMTMSLIGKHRRGGEEWIPRPESDQSTWMIPSHLSS
jgi:hypothetical protein